jgi:DNA end-binding protein Ku
VGIVRPMWKGEVTFGLVSVPVRMYSATEDHDVELHQVHAPDGGRIRYRRTCEACGETVAREDIVRAFDDGASVVTLTDEDLQSLPVSESKEIEVVEFVPREQVDPIRFDRSYYLEPAAKSPKAYLLLKEVLDRTERMAVVHLTVRTRSRLAALRTYGDVMTLHTLLWDDEVREADFPALAEDVAITDQELEMSSMLVESLSEDFTPERFRDDYQVQLRELIDAKLESGGEAVRPRTTAAAKSGGEVVDLMEALQRSVEEARRQREEGASRGDDKEQAEEAKPAPARRGRRKAV